MDWSKTLDSLEACLPSPASASPNFSQIEGWIEKTLKIASVSLLFREGNVFKGRGPKKLETFSPDRQTLRHLMILRKHWVVPRKSKKIPWVVFWPVFVEGDCAAGYALGVRSGKNSVSLSREEKKLLGIISERTSIFLKQKRLQDDLEIANRLSVLGWLSAAMIHEIRNPLAALSSLLQLLPQKKEEPLFLEAFQKTAKKEINRLVELTEGIGHFLKISPEKQEQIDLNRLVDHVCHLVGPLFKSKGVTLKSNTRKSLFLYGEEGPLEILLFNLLQNAFQAAEKGGRVEINSVITRPVNGTSWVKLEVRDNGKGISQEDLPGNFKPFFSNKKTGMGIGLAICQDILKNHHGHWKWKSLPGRGTTVTLYFPSSDRV